MIEKEKLKELAKYFELKNGKVKKCYNKLMENEDYCRLPQEKQELYLAKVLEDVLFDSFIENKANAKKTKNIISEVTKTIREETTFNYGTINPSNPDYCDAIYNGKYIDDDSLYTAEINIKVKKLKKNKPNN